VRVSSNDKIKQSGIKRFCVKYC